MFGCCKISSGNIKLILRNLYEYKLKIRNCLQHPIIKPMKHYNGSLWLHSAVKLKKWFFLFLLFILQTSVNAQQLRVVVAGLNHDHIHNVLHAFNEGRINIVGIAEPNKQLWQKFGKLKNWYN
jgi:hypothetical protein